MLYASFSIGQVLSNSIVATSLQTARPVAVPNKALQMLEAVSFLRHLARRGWLEGRAPAAVVAPGWPFQVAKRKFSLQRRHGKRQLKAGSQTHVRGGRAGGAA